LIFWLVTYSNGETKLSMDEVNKLGIVAHPLAEDIGLETGDKIIDISGKPISDFSQVVSSDVLLGENNYYTIDRNGERKEVPIPNDLYNKLSEDEDKSFIDPLQTFTVKEVQAQTPAAEIGLKEGDKIIGLNDSPIDFYNQFVTLAEQNANKEVALSILRNSDTLNLNTTLTEDGKLGFVIESGLNFDKIDLGLGQAFVLGSGRAFSVITDNIKGFKKIFSGQVKASKALAGPVGIAQKFYGGVWNWGRFWLITGMLSMALAFMNLLPIPALDGGHALILLYEMISGRKPSEKFMERTQQVGMVILLTLLVLIFFNDIVQGFF
jgi:regulator of sigma E protease